MVKVIKSTIVERMMDKSELGTVKYIKQSKQANKVLSVMFGIIKQTLVNGNSVRIGNNGKLTTYFKDSKRPVRNPKTGEEMIMQDRWVVSFLTTSSRSVSTQAGFTLPTSGLCELIANHEDVLAIAEDLKQEKFENAYTAKASFLAKLAVDCFSELLAECIDTFTVMEIRDFGTFKTKRVKRDFVRNPKNDERVPTKDTDIFRRTTFSESKRMKRDLLGKTEG